MSTTPAEATPAEAMPAGASPEEPEEKALLESIIAEFAEQRKKYPDWDESYERNLEWANRIAMRAPIVHVDALVHKKDKVATPAEEASAIDRFVALLTTPPYYLSVSSEESSEKTLKTEAAYGLGACCYFYAGRAHESFGKVAFAFGPEIEKDASGKHVSGSASHFDTGGMYHGHIPCHLTQQQSIDYLLTKNKKPPLAAWREIFREYLAQYFDPCLNYWLDIPSRNDPQGILLCNVNPNKGDWRRWTWEVRLNHGPCIEACIGWITTIAGMARLDVHDVDASENVAPAPDSVMEKCINRAGSDSYCQDLEAWILYECIMEP